MTNSNDPRNIFVDNRNGFAGDESTEQNTSSRQPDTGKNGTTNNADTQGASGGVDSYEARVNEMKRLAAKYQREGEGQLVRDIVNNVIEQKAAGKLTNQQLIAFANRVAPLLNTDQKQRLSELVEQLVKL